jgi:hypothetical protein
MCIKFFLNCVFMIYGLYVVTTKNLTVLSLILFFDGDTFTISV